MEKSILEDSSLSLPAKETKSSRPGTSTLHQRLGGDRMTRRDGTNTWDDEEGWFETTNHREGKHQRGG